MPVKQNTIDVQGDIETFDAIISGEQTDFYDDQLSVLGRYRFLENAAITSIELPNLRTIGSNSIKDLPNLAYAMTDNVETVESNSLMGNLKLKTMSISNATSVGSYVCGDTPFVTPTFNKNVSFEAYYAMYHGPGEITISKAIRIKGLAFASNYNLCSLILLSDELSILENPNAFNNTPIANGYGYIYVPADLLDSYKTATNWSTLAAQIVSINEYPKITYGTITDTWEQIFAAESNGTYKTKYAIGDTKVMNVNGLQVPMVIVAFDEDNLADDSGKAKITWMSIGTVLSTCCNLEKGTIADWGTSYMRNLLNNDVYSLIETTVRNNIKLVHKISYSALIEGNSISDDYLWVPSLYEFGGDAYSRFDTCESTGPKYTEYYTSATVRTRKMGCYAIGSSTWAWLRSAAGTATPTNFYRVTSSGGLPGAGAGGGISSDFALFFGFCT